MIVASTMAGCSSSQDRTYKPRNRFIKERLAFVEKHQKYIQGTDEDKVITEDCDQYLKAAESLKLIFHRLLRYFLLDNRCAIRN